MNTKIFKPSNHKLAQAISQSFHASRWNGAALTELNTLGGITGWALGINDSGQIVGQSTIAGEDAQHATLWNGTTPTGLGTLGGTNSTAANINNAYAINDHGVIVGQTSKGLYPATANYAAFKLTPTTVPVPGAVWLLGSALAGLVGVSPRKLMLAA